jgi:hypothetical protein
MAIAGGKGTFQVDYNCNPVPVSIKFIFFVPESEQKEDFTPEAL